MNNLSHAACVPEPVSIVMPCRNEVRHIAACLESVLANDYPQDRLEVLVVDGMSDDGTRGIVEAYAARYACVRLLDNPRQLTPFALNIGVRAARHGIVMRMDAHTTYPPDYIRRCASALRTLEADNVGGIWVISPREQTWLARAVAAVLSHRFGVGNAYYRLAPSEPREVDTVPFGCYRRDVFDRVGMFDENLRRGQDMDFNLRLRAAGGRILLVPDVVSYYHPRTSVWAFMRHNLWNGVWVLYPMRYGRVAFMPRHLVPGVFIAALFVSGVTGLVWRPAWGFTAAAASSYAIAVLLATGQLAWRRRSAEFLINLPPVFAALHIAYGVGTIAGFLRVLPRREFWRLLLRRALRG